MWQIAKLKTDHEGCVPRYPKMFWSRCVVSWCSLSVPSGAVGSAAADGFNEESSVGWVGSV